MRPTLLPNLRRLWRDARTLQLGTEPGTALVVELARPEVARALDLLDGGLTLRGVIDDAAALGLSEADVRDMVDLLEDEGLLLGSHELTPTGLPENVRRRLVVEASAIALRLRNGQLAGSTPADTLRKRAAARVLVSGDGPLIAPVAAALAAAGVGHIDPALDGLAEPSDVLVGGLGLDDVRQPRAIATAAAIGRTAPDTNLTPVPADSASFLVHFGERQSTALAKRGVRLRNVPQLEVGVRLGTVTVGPLVRPGTSPCRECLEWHRRDRDPAWPVLRAQLATSPHRAGEPCAHSTALAGVAYVAEEVLAYLDGGELRTEAAIVEIDRAGETRRRAWGAHPRCDCRRRRRTRQAG